MMFATFKRSPVHGILLFLQVALAFGWGGAPPVWALDGRKLVSQYVMHEWSTEHGLPGNYVEKVFQNKEGYLWLGLRRNGLARFDGARFAPWPLEAPNREEEISVGGLCETRDGSLWAGTDGAGLWRFQGLRRVRYTKNEGLPNDNVRALHLDRAGVLWIGLSGRALAQFTQDRLVTVPVPEDGPSSVVEFFEDRQGGMWMAGDGLWHFQEGKFTDVRKNLGLRPERFTSVREGLDGSIWVGTMRGLLRLQGRNVKTYLEVDGLSDDQVRALLLDRDGNLWIGTNSGLDRYRDDQFTRCLNKDHAPYDLVYDIFEDREGSLWIGTNGGLTRLRDDKFSNLTTKDGLLQNLTAAVVEGPEGSLWVASRTRGIAHLKGGATTIYDKQLGLPRDSMKCIHADRHGVIWAGTQQGGLTRIAGGAVSTVGTEGELKGRRVAAIQDDPEGHLWLLVEDGVLFRYRNGELNGATEGDDLVGAKVEAIHLGPGPGFWAVTEAGLNLRRDGRWRHFAFPEGLKGRPVRSLFEDRDGAVWLCLIGGGLARFSDGRFARYDSRQGLFDDSPYVVLEDNRNHLWIGCGQGVFRVAKADFERLDRGVIKTIPCTPFSEADGMSSRRCSRVGYPLATKLRDGRLCFPTDRGLAMVDPEKLPRNPIVPSVVIESVVLDHHRFPPEGLPTLPSRTKDVEIHYSGISLRGADKVQFKYQLEGYDEDWVEAKGRRIAHYQNLAPQRYRFRVIAANEDGVWNRDGATFVFTKEPLFFQTAGFYLGCGSLIVVLGGLIHWTRISRARKRFSATLEERTRIARELHDTLEQGLVGISMQLNLAAAKFSQAPSVGHKHLEKARYMLRVTMADARSAISNLRSNASRRRNIIGECERIADGLTTGNSVRLVTRGSAEAVELPPFTGDTLVRIAQEAMTNIVKHAGASTIELDLVNEASQLTLRIRDDGTGFDVASAIGANEGRYGLLGMRERTEKLGGTLTISSAPGRGTLIEVVLPRGHALPRLHEVKSA